VKIRKGDEVLVIAGKDRGKKGRVRFVFTKKNRVMVEGVNFIKTHSRAGAQVRQAGLIEREVPLNVSNVMLMCSRCKSPVRIGSQVLEDGRRARVCRSCNEVID
jgi:large subunit ribosomal protein L24